MTMLTVAILTNLCLAPKFLFFNSGRVTKSFNAEWYHVEKTKKNMIMLTYNFDKISKTDMKTWKLLTQWQTH